MLTRLRRPKGFSLVELLVVITIIAILSVVAYTAVGGQTAKARDSKRKEDIGSLITALELYYQANNAYPVAVANAIPLSGPLPGGTDDMVPNYINVIPTDPLTPTTAQQYVYINNAATGTFQIATTLENDKGTGDDRAYVAGNGSNLITSTIIGAAAVEATTGLACAGGTVIATNGSCIPYRPN